MTLAPRTRLGPYEIVAPLGAGGMGEVYRARDSRLGREVAVKIVPAELAGDPDLQRRFELEARAASALNHPNILTVHDFGQDDGTAFLVTELLQGETLRARIERGALPLATALDLSEQIARGLAAAHERGIVHRDLKPENLFVTKDGRIKILDFGLARLVGAKLGSLAEAPTLMETEAGTVLGTAGYMAPEQVLGEPADARADLFAFGCVLFEMLTGEHAFRGASVIDILHAIVRGEPALAEPGRPPLPAALERLLRHCLEKNADARFQSARDLLYGLAEARSTTIGAAPGVNSTSAPAPRSKPRALGFALAAAALVAALGLTLVFRKPGLFGPSGAAIDSLAVLPLANFSGDPAEEFFADGMTEALIAELAKIRALKVISRTSVMQYKGAQRPLPEIARELGVRGVVEGSVVRESGSVRITVQLIDAAEDRHLWAESYTREEKDVLRLQGEMATAIAREIRIAVSPAEAKALASARTVDPQAHQLLLQARELVRRGSTQRDEQQRISDLVERAIALAPDFAAAHVFRGLQINSLASTGYEAATTTCPPARAELATALALDPQSIDAQSLDAELRANCDYDWQGALDVHRAALDAAPGNADLHSGYAAQLSLVARHAEAFDHIQRAAELDPLNDWIAGDRVRTMVLARRFPEAIEIGRQALELAPDSVFLKWNLGNAQLAAGDRVAALATYLSRKVARPDMNFMVGLLYGLDGKRTEARAVLEYLLERREQRYVPATMLGVLYAGLAERDLAFEWLERAHQEHDYFLHPLAVDPMFDPLRDDPRFAALVEKMNFPKVP